MRQFTSLLDINANISNYLKYIQYLPSFNFAFYHNMVLLCIVCNIKNFTLNERLVKNVLFKSRSAFTPRLCL